MNYTQLPDEVLPKVRSWSAMQLGIWADVYTMGKAGMIYYRTNEQLAERWQTDERTVRRVVKQLTELGAVTAKQDGRRRILTAVLDFEERRRTNRSTVQADHGPTSPRTKQSAMEDQAVREGGPTGPQKEDQAVPQVEQRVDKEVEKEVDKKTKPKKEARPKSLDVVIEAFLEAGSTEHEANNFWDYWESKGWARKGDPVKDWKATARYWLRNPLNFNNRNGKPQLTADQQANNRAKFANYLRTGQI